MTTCDDLVQFAGAELDAERANALRDHLRSCLTCRRNLVEAMQLNARLEQLASLVRSAVDFVDNKSDLRQWLDEEALNMDKVARGERRLSFAAWKRRRDHERGRTGPGGAA